jgi:urease accessory protein
MSTDLPSLYRLLAWLSPSYPVGAFSHSHGLEWAVEVGDVTSGPELADWIRDVLLHGGGRQDALLLAAAWRTAGQGDRGAFEEVAELARALAPSRERREETLSQGQAFHRITASAWPGPGADEGPRGAEGHLTAPRWVPPERPPLPYPVAVGFWAARHRLPLDATLHAYLHAFVANLVSAGLRLFAYGQTEAQALLAQLEPQVAEVAEVGACGTLDDLGGSALLADIASMRHETQYTRLFRT